MTTTVEDVMAFVNENDVKFVRLAFCDLMGVPKNIAIMANQLESAFEKGVSFDAAAVQGFSDISHSDLFLFPDPATLSILPWRPGPGTVIRLGCDIYTPDGTPYMNDARHCLRHVLERAKKMDIDIQVGTECEFYLFKLDEDGNPTDVPYDKGGYMDIAPLDKGENIRREICLAMEEMGLKPEASHHEQGPGQNEIDFAPAEAITAADHLLAFKACVKSIASRNGLFASFLPKPLLDKPGSGLHVNISLWQNGYNVTQGSDLADGFIAGVLANSEAMSVFLNPLGNSYARLGRHEAPKYISWSHHNRSQLVRIPAAKGDNARFELRSPDPSINPYLAFSLVLSAGLDGIEQQLPLQKAVDDNLYHASAVLANKLTLLPESIEAAIGKAIADPFIAKVLGQEMLTQYMNLVRGNAALKTEALFHLV